LGHGCGKLIEFAERLVQATDALQEKCKIQSRVGEARASSECLFEMNNRRSGSPVSSRRLA
jgi:hypothetical protein